MVRVRGNQGGIRLVDFRYGRGWLSVSTSNDLGEFLLFSKWKVPKIDQGGKKSHFLLGGTMNQARTFFRASGGGCQCLSYSISSTTTVIVAAVTGNSSSSAFL